MTCAPAKRKPHCLYVVNLFAVLFSPLQSASVRAYVCVTMVQREAKTALAIVDRALSRGDVATKVHPFNLCGWL